jgi:site-specific DNA-methyltransferase (adenine-specific)
LNWKELYLNKTNCIDTIIGMKDIPNETINLIVTDPPYLMNYKSNRRIKQEKFDYIANDKNANDLIAKYIEESYRILKNNSAMYMFCSWHHIDFFKQEVQKYFNLKNIIVWNKNNHGSGDLKGSYAPKHEFIIFAHKGRCLFRDKRIPDVIDFPKINSNKLLHPTEKPIGLLEIFIKNSSDENDIIFDGFMGSGSVGIASINLNRQYIGFELNENFTKIANNRTEIKY